MFAVAADAFTCPALTQWRRVLYKQTVNLDELEVLCGDGTMKASAWQGWSSGAMVAAPEHRARRRSVDEGGETCCRAHVCTALGSALMQAQPGAVVLPEDRHRVRWLVVDNARVALATKVRKQFSAFGGAGRGHRA